MATLDPRAIERIGGPSWSLLRDHVLEAATAILSASPRTKNQLTTIYVKFERPDGSVYAVMWIKKSSEAVVGLSLPDGVDSDRLHEAPKGMKYAGLSRYCTITASDAVPSELAGWSKLAFEHQ